MCRPKHGVGRVCIGTNRTESRKRHGASAFRLEAGRRERAPTRMRRRQRSASVSSKQQVAWFTSEHGARTATTAGCTESATSPGPGIPATAAIVTPKNLVAATRPRPVHSWDTDMDEPGIDLALARQRLLDAADELFYRQGMHRVSIDRVIEKAGVPAETLREAFGGTDELVLGLPASPPHPIAGRPRTRPPRLPHTA